MRVHPVSGLATGQDRRTHGMCHDRIDHDGLHLVLVVAQSEQHARVCVATTEGHNRRAPQEGRCAGWSGLQVRHVGLPFGQVGA